MWAVDVRKQSALSGDFERLRDAAEAVEALQRRRGRGEGDGGGAGSDAATLQMRGRLVARRIQRHAADCANNPRQSPPTPSPPSPPPPPPLLLPLTVRQRMAEAESEM